MRQGSFRAVRRNMFLAVLLLLMLSLTTVSVFSDERTVNYLSVVVESFNGQTVREWNYSGRNFRYDFDWAVDGSRFASREGTTPFPRMTYVEAWPVQLFGSNPIEQNVRSLGIWGSFDRRGHNWIDVYPVVTGSGQDEEPPIPYEIPMPGRILTLDLWVWGSNLNYTLEAYFRDHLGLVHAIPMGSLAYSGWRNLRVNIPHTIPQSRRIQPRYAGLQFVKFRIWTTPNERVDNFFVYFNQMQVLTDTFETYFDGNDLADPENVRALWAQN